MTLLKNVKLVTQQNKDKKIYFYASNTSDEREAVIYCEN